MNIEDLARKAKCAESISLYGLSRFSCTSGDLERFAALVAEECAKVCDEMFSDGALTIADAIRAKFKAL